MELDRMLKALGEPMRLKIYQALLERKHCVRSLSKMHIPPSQSTLNRSRCAPKPRRLCTATAAIVHRKSTHKQTPAETFPPP